MEEIVQLNSNAKLSEHFTLGEFTKSGSHPEVYNIPSHEAIANLKRLCTWLEVLRERYNERYVVTILPPKVGGNQRGLNERLNNPLLRPPLAPPTFLDKPSGIAERGGGINTNLNNLIDHE